MHNEILLFKRRTHRRFSGGADYIFPPIDVHKTAIAYGTTAFIYEQEAHNLFLEKNWQQAADAAANFILP